MLSTNWTLLIFCIILPSFYTESITKFIRLNFTQLAQGYGLECEEHDVITEDKYIIKLFRLHGRYGEGNGRPVLLWHGFLDSADTYIIRGNRSTSIQLAEAGYDVWVGNSRGNRYSRRHMTLDPDKDTKFWDFSFHEMGYYDLPAAIDYILNETNEITLSAIGHSQGTTIFYVLGSTRPEYNEKIELFISLAPIAYLNHMKSIIGLYVPLWPVIKRVLWLTKTHELFTDGSPIRDLIQVFCRHGSMGFEFCEQDVLFPIVGYDEDELEPEFFDVVLNHFFAGTSTKDLEHFTQIISGGRFANFDYGWTKNLVKYGHFTPPAYDLKKVSMRIALIGAKNDYFSSLEDVDRLREELPNVPYYEVMHRKEFNHIDFTWGKHIHLYLNPLIKKLLKWQ